MLHPLAAWEISLAPGFSRVMPTVKMENRFNGFFQERGGKPLKRLNNSLPANTRLKPGANENGTIPASAR